MRELYACQLDMSCADQQLVRRSVLEWIARGSELDVGELDRHDDDELTGPAGHSVASSRHVEEGVESWLWTWRRSDESDPTLVWQLQLALGPLPERPTTVRFTIRVAHDRTDGSRHVAPVRYAFGAPAIVRTLLREHQVLDAGWAVQPAPRTHRAHDITALVGWLQNHERSLPVLVVTRHRDKGLLVDVSDLARQLAGIAHVEVLATHLAERALADSLGYRLGVWGGGIRLYWPGFTLSDDPFGHRLWNADRVAGAQDFVGSTRNWIATVAAASLPTHPAVIAVRAQRRSAPAGAGLVPVWIEQYVAELESTNDDQAKELRALQQALVESQQREEDLQAQLTAMQRQWGVVSRAGNQEDEEEPEALDWRSIDVQAAFDLARAEAGPNVVYLPETEDSVRDFVGYGDPRRLYDALSKVAEAADAWQDGSLGAGFGAFFAQAGYEYAARNPSAKARKTRQQYARRYGGTSVVMEPHLKVDQATSPDQCLRIYWYVDEVDKKIVIGHVGRHLPDP